MSIWQYLLLLAGGLLLIFAASLAPEHFFRIATRLAVNAGCGLALLLLVNAFSAATGLILPLNGLTLAVSSLLGAPGMVAVTALAAL